MKTLTEMQAKADLEKKPKFAAAVIEKDICPVSQTFPPYPYPARDNF